MTWDLTTGSYNTMDLAQCKRGHAFWIGIHTSHSTKKETSLYQFSYPKKPGSLPLRQFSYLLLFWKNESTDIYFQFIVFLVSMCFTPLKQLSLKSLMASLRLNQTDNFHSCSKNKWKLHKFKSLMLHLLAVWPWEFTSSFYSSGS